ncbi:uncharacterized protein BP5553_03940 [Venustampulla echinocandica]|uniref:Uncharacterized protein n=1 Tax=Venustampulla echinocandica TaxID=2656787 RepID=A0A370TVP5_9HELO|nr:uncharacterized protein BP5553_03940 [Venustampulla echinocandica]RDL39600.1 hypothetical protein BP5553_03940 [Venustampulla echinocandica]
MPSYFYHLKFELYGHLEPAGKTGQKPEGASIVWLPPAGSDIFATADWPRHKIANPQQQEHNRERTRRVRDGDYRPTKQEPVLGAVGAVIDCGPARASNYNVNPAEDHDSVTLQTIPADTTLEFPPPVPQRIHRDLESARKDWRFGKVRLESFDMAPPRTELEHRPRRHARGESSGGTPQVSTGGHNGINAGLAAGGVGRVTRGRFEVLEGKNTELGWGVVRLYRDGEEMPELGIENGSSRSGVYDEAQNSPASSALGMKDGGVGQGKDCTTLCIPAVPSYLTPGDFLGFVGEKTREQVSHFRIVMTERMNRYLVLMKFRDSGEARKWRAEWDGKVFNSMEPETCHVVFVKSISFQTPTSSRPNNSFPELSHDPFTPSSSASAFLKPFPPPTPNLIELPTCPVCLERMDDTTGLLTILCQHVFHCACLQKWRGSGCPVCRHTNPSLSHSSPQNNHNASPYDSSNPPFGSGEASLCSVCDCTDDLWICLICGTVGCGRYKGGHAKEHWKDSAHNFALEIETQHVWDYAGDTWVHRLIRDKGDGKVVELPSSSRPGMGTGRGDRGHEDMDLVPREKLENIGMEYTHLLTSQLESQRVYFEELVGKAVVKATAASSAASSAKASADSALSRLKEIEIENNSLRKEVVVGLEKDLAREKQRAERSSEVARGFGKSLMEEKKVSEGLMDRINHMNKGVMEMSQQLTALKEENVELKEQNRDLLFSITGQQKLQEMEAEGGGLDAGELEGGTLSLPPEKKKGKGKGKGRGK